ncbi:MAG: hypothetical protein QOJ03_116 [Frankiaceae bacterium]|nr:hypothetical protein [Frankiaceae bacterium]
MPVAPSATPLSRERKLAVLMFADLTGYTELCRRLDPEDVATTVHPLMAAMRRAVEAEGGVVPSTAGDGFMAVYGVPAARADLAGRALRSADAIRALIARHNEAVVAFRIPDVHIGIAAGEVLVVPSEEAIGWSLIGNAVNLASRLCDAAGPDEVLVDGQFRALAGPATFTGQQRTVTVSGVGDDLSVWTVERSVSRSATAVTSVAFVDRREALQRLDREWEETTTLGISRVLAVAGETGIGKSRLLGHWLERGEHAHVWTWCGAADRTSALASMVETVATVAPARAAGALERVRATTQPASAGLRADPFPAVVASAREIMEAAVAEAPLIIVLDDAHLADPSLLGFVDDLRHRPIRGAALVVVTWRNDEAVPPWTPELELNPLGDADAADLVVAALGARPPAELTDAVVARIGGHPLMALQSAAYLIESGVVTIADEHCELRSAEAMEALPTSLRLFVAARIDRLPADDKAALQELSTFGERIDEVMLQRLAGAHVTAAVPRLIDRGLLRTAESGFRFAHGLVQQVAYSSLPRSVRAELHRRHWQSQDLLATGQRMFHALRWADCVSSTDVDMTRAAVAAALHASEAHATLLFATQAAAAHATVRQIGGLLEDNAVRFPAEACRLHTLASRSLLEMGRFEESLHAADRALEAAGMAGPPGGALLRAFLARGHALSRLRRFQAARQTLDDALALSEQLDDQIGRGQALRLMGDTWRHSSFPDFMALTEQAHDILATAGDREGSTECACILAYLTSTSAPARFERWRSAAAAAVDRSDARGQLWLARADAEAAHIRLDHDAAATAAATSIELGELLGSTDGIADGLRTTVLSMTQLGRLPEALDAFERLRTLAVANANPRMRIVAAAGGCLALLRSGRLTEALDEYNHAVNAVSGFGASEATEVMGLAASIARDRGQWSVAARHIRQAMEGAQSMTSAMDLLSARVAEAIIFAEGGEPSGPDYLARLAAEAVDLGAPALGGLAAAAAEQQRLAADQQAVMPGPGATLEELAIRADTAGLLAERSGSDVAAAWGRAAAAWGRLGDSIWLARAHYRAGASAAAEEALVRIGADDEGRGWALSR